jgi:hypothetical protein
MYTREIMIEFGKNNFEEIFNSLGKREQGALLGCITEIAVVQNRKAQATDKEGYDMIENGLEKEIKSCFAYNGPYARWGNITSKQNKCDAFVFIDGVKNKEYEVPHDVVIYEMAISPHAGGEIRTTEHNLSILNRYEILNKEGK